METAKSRNKGKWVVSGIITALLAGIIVYFTLFSTDTIIVANVDNRVGETVKVEAKVTSFYYDQSSKTKFLKLLDETGEIEAVIFENVKVPYINEGATYTFTGLVQRYDGRIELKVESVQ